MSDFEPDPLHDIQQCGLVQRLGETGSEEIAALCAVLSAVGADGDDGRVLVLVVCALNVASSSFAVD